MKINISFEKFSRYYILGQPLNFYIYIKFTECSYEEFYDWLDKRGNRLADINKNRNYFEEISYSEKVIQLVKNE